ncbi:hypothetical protein [Mycobacterium vicinigordonae]|uniref:Uncharacterized protein n=1 Tax=Mycobacterium vicinigordonae TaxID=1719132 RepID=A0A7D6HML3_9MYCO|nr:hypothetical protein [Mycobacterium vicinigordonae]QLL06011.1 hypothetical protein H0P51_19800 [Mycobacterium vicinigordonae]
MSTFEFHEPAARAAAKHWKEAANTLNSVAQAAAEITGRPWGGGEIGDAFNEQFEPDRRTVQQQATQQKKTVQSVEPVLTRAANVISEQSRNLT